MNFLFLLVQSLLKLLQSHSWGWSYAYRFIQLPQAFMANRPWGKPHKSIWNLQKNPNILQISTGSFWTLRWTCWKVISTCWRIGVILSNFAWPGISRPRARRNPRCWTCGWMAESAGCFRYPVGTVKAFGRFSCWSIQLWILCLLPLKRNFDTGVILEGLEARVSSEAGWLSQGVTEL